MPKVSIIVPTHNRNEKVFETVAALRKQDFPADEYEIIVVDDGSKTPVKFAEDLTLPAVSLVRLEGVERSIARNTGAKSAHGELLIFVDDDVLVNPDFVKCHWKAHLDFPEALGVGSIRLPPERANEPFVSFRQNLETSAVPEKYGLVSDGNFCTAQNMAIAATGFTGLDGFADHMVSSEDQDFALRHTARGGRIVFVPEALGTHYDSALDIVSYCRRNEWGSRLMEPFYERYPDLGINIERERVNGLIKPGAEPLGLSAHKAVKKLAATGLMTHGLFLVAGLLENTIPKSRLLQKVYRILLGVHIFRGYRSVVAKQKRNAPND